VSEAGSGAPRVREATFGGRAGTVFYRAWVPAQVRAVAVIVHGYAEHGGRYGHVAEVFAGHGIATYAPDHCGHGRSEGERALIHDFEDVVEDLTTVLELAAVEHPGVPTVMIGHSMGGLLTARVAQCHPDRLAGVAFLGAVLGEWQWAREVLALPELPPSDSDPSGMSRDEAACRAYAEDPLVYHGLYKRQLLEAEVVCLGRFNDELDRITMAVGFFHGEADPFVPYQGSLDAVRRMPSAQVEVHLYEGARHELVNETNRDEVIADLCAFVRRVTGT
jgi:alpha-beta hydrolase superfamily lysophospholipase